MYLFTWKFHFSLKGGYSGSAVDATYGDLYIPNSPGSGGGNGGKGGGIIHLHAEEVSRCPARKRSSYIEISECKTWYQCMR